MRPVRLLLSGLVTAVGLGLLARGSALALPWHERPSARLRLSWSARPERIERCRQVSAEEQARREEHMRQRVECEGSFASYALRVEVDRRVMHESVVRGGGFRHDRPLHVLEDLELPAGSRTIRVTLTRREATDNDADAFLAPVTAEADTGLFAGRAEREATERVRRARAAIPPELVLDTTVTLAPRQVGLVTFDAIQRRLAIR